MVRLLDSGQSSLGLSLFRMLSYVRGQVTYSQSASLHPAVYMSTAKALVSGHPWGAK